MLQMPRSQRLKVSSEDHRNRFWAILTVGFIAFLALSRKNSKPRRCEPHAPNYQNDTAKQQCNFSGSVNVHGEVQVDLHPDVKQADAAKEKKNDSRESTKRILEVSTLLAVLLYSSLTWWQGCMTRKLVKTAQDTFETSNRPYVGLSGFSVKHMGLDSNGRQFLEDSKTDRTTSMVFRAAVKNYGTIPGENFFVNIDFRIDGAKYGVLLVPSPHTEIYPSEVRFVQDGIVEDRYSAVMQGNAIAQFNLTISYDGPGHKRYGDCTRFQYLPSINDFGGLGAICDTPWKNPFNYRDRSR
jgi:hypothetical protein